MGDIILKFQLKDILNCIIEEDLSEYLKLKIKDKQYSAAYENDSIYKFEVPDTEKNFNFQLSLEHEDYDNKIYNTSESSLVYSNTVCNFINKYNIPVVYACKKSEKYTIIELKAYHLDDNFNKLFNDNYERYFYKANSLVELEVKLRDDKVVDDDQIQWGIISWHDLYSIEKENNHELLSNEYSLAIQKELHEKFKSFSYDIIEKKGSRYICELPNYQQDEPHELYIFAYISEDEITKYNSVKLCINDYTQVVIDVTLAEALRADTEVAQLGWATSYVLQRLWHDNPSNAKELDELIYKTSDDIINSIKKCEIRNTLSIIPEIKISKYEPKKEIKEKFPHVILDNVEIKVSSNKIENQSNEEKIKYQDYFFYVTLGWETFYLKFPMIKSALSKNIMNEKIYTHNYYKDLLRFLLNDLMIKPKIGKSLDLYMYARLPQLYSRKNDNKYSLEADMRTTLGKEPNPSSILLNKLEPYMLVRNHFQHFDFSDVFILGELDLSFLSVFREFVSQKEIDLKDNNIAKENIALYSVTGKFSLYYVPYRIKIRKKNSDDELTDKYSNESDYIAKLYEKLDIKAPLYAYVYDYFDFNDSPQQPVGVWDYKNMVFNIYDSIRALGEYKRDITEKTAYWSLEHWVASAIFDITEEEKKEFEKNYKFILKNIHYQQNKNSMNKGFDYLIYSDKMLDVDKYGV